MRRAAVPLLLLLTISAPVRTQPLSEELSLEQAARLALERNLEYQAAVKEVDIALARQQQARALPQPRLEARLSWQHLPEVPALRVPPIAVRLPNPANPQSPLSWNIPVPELELAKANARRATLSFSMPLYTSGRLESAIRAAAIGVRASEESARARAEDVVLQVTQAYLQTVLSQRVEQVHQQALEVVQAHLQQAEALYQQGLVAQYDVLRAQAELATQQKRLTDARNGRELARAALLNLLNLPQGQPLQLSTPLREVAFPLSYEESVQAALKTSPEIRALRLKSQAQQALAYATEAEAKPQVLFSVNVETWTRDLSAIEPHASLTIGMRWNLFDAGYARAAAREQREGAERTEIERQRVENLLALRVKQALLDLEAAQQGLAAAQRAVETAQESLRLARRRFETGMGTSVEVLDAILATSQAQLQREQALYQMNVAYYTLLRLTGRLLNELQLSPQEVQRL
ncbi:MAG: TolC family protein [Armatimonadota bacterium]|nr:TolC family protein [Armatimonadota bacterium]MDW8290152.1 TolC family protein [Armatimonadota bacterium]